MLDGLVEVGSDDYKWLLIVPNWYQLLLMDDDWCKWELNDWSYFELNDEHVF